MKKIHAVPALLGMLLAVAANAQTAAAANAAAAAAEPVATTQEKADEAMKKAVPATNVGTVVRTDSSQSQPRGCARARRSQFAARRGCAHRHPQACGRDASAQNPGAAPRPWLNAISVFLFKK